MLRSWTLASRLPGAVASRGLRTALTLTATLAVALAGSRAPARAGRITVPLNVGVGPAAHFLTGKLQRDQVVHGGLRLQLFALIDQAAVRANWDQIPAKWRGRASKIKELRVGHLLIPDTLFLSPKVNKTQMWGVTFRPLSLGIPLVRRPVRLHVGVGLIATYAYIQSDDPQLGTTHFLRPGLDARVDLEIALTRRWLVSLGWTSQFYVPQKVGGPIDELGALEDSLWHIGQAYLLLNYRFPYSTRI